jgi:putative ABC transport system ATP-binding protein
MSNKEEAMNDFIVQAQNIQKIYNPGKTSEVAAVRDVSLDIRKGEFVGIMGASGSGKSTVMNILGCLDRPTSGTVLLDRMEVSGLPDDELAKVRNKLIGFVFQSFNLLPRTTALENVELPLVYSERANIGRLARMALEAVGLKHRDNHYPGELSGGEQQRVAIARALVNEPEIIFADEPTGNLDSRSSYEVISLFQKLNGQGKTIVLVTHEPDIAEYARRIIRISDGRVVEDRVNENPKNAEGELRKLSGKEAKE